MISPAPASVGQETNNGATPGTTPSHPSNMNVDGTTNALSVNTGSGQLPERSPSRSSVRANASHRQSFVENLRNPPPSPRSLRHLSFTHQAVQDLVNHPPPQRMANPRFAGRDWQDVSLGELISDHEVKWAELDTTVEDCTKTAVATFDHRDLNAYLLVVIGRAKPEPTEVEVYRSVAERAYGRVGIPVRDIQPICHKDPITTLLLTQNLAAAIELFGSGVRRILVTDPTSSEAVGILSPLRLLEFFWIESVNFPSIDRLYPMILRDLRIGSQDIISINADRPLADALTLMNDEGLTSVAVVDNGQNVVGNISTTDIEHLTSVASFPLLHSSCMHFISVILSERGVEEGQDSFPVFSVNPHTTLAHTVAKLVATRSHRMWIVDVPSPSASAPQTPLLTPVTTGPVSGSSFISPPSHQRSSSNASASAAAASAAIGCSASHSDGILISMTNSTRTSGSAREPSNFVPDLSATGSSNGAHVYGSVPAAAMPGAHLSGRLAGVVSLTDILNLFAKTSGLRPGDLSDIRARRRRSSSTS
ncbi:cbs domain containing protein [Grosmannia clavigera kw1407]|uniref:Cbs domain containing protein n=1 Tax=Grosmannia clavigera (strain kw1407 / UAMH 11150) TaxID=655863 RepID=F0XR89_GROCL|nr:cbs domain containing protein [Grosmannia clavigera kw1407]EFW99926.1 cbs domain containing protein [Grosmannia clavigera kw1407]